MSTYIADLEHEVADATARLRATRDKATAAEAMRIRADLEYKAAQERVHEARKKLSRARESDRQARRRRERREGVKLPAPPKPPEDVSGPVLKLLSDFRGLPLELRDLQDELHVGEKRLQKALAELTRTGAVRLKLYPQHPRKPPKRLYYVPAEERAA